MLSVTVPDVVILIVEPRLALMVVLAVAVAADAAIGASARPTTPAPQATLSEVVGFRIVLFSFLYYVGIVAALTKMSRALCLLICQLAMFTRQMAPTNDAYHGPALPSTDSMTTTSTALAVDVGVRHHLTTLYPMAT